MTEVIVTRGGQITLTRDVREKMRIHEGDLVSIHVLGDIAMVSKRNLAVFEKHDFLPENFTKTLKEIRTFSWDKRLKKLGIIS